MSHEVQVGGHLAIAEFAPNVESDKLLKTVVVLLGYRGCLDANERHRAKLIARSQACRVILVALPRLRLRDRSDRKTLRDLVLGRMHRVGNQVANALDATRGTDGSNSIYLVGYSLGASVAASLAAALPASSVKSLILIEPVAWKRWNPLKLWKASRAEAQRDNAYLSESGSDHDWRIATEPGGEYPGWRLNMGSVALPLSACWGHLVREIGAAFAVQSSMQLVAITGRGSRICPPEAAEGLCRKTTNVGIASHRISIDGSHGFWHSIERTLVALEAALNVVETYDKVRTQNSF